MTRLSDEIFDLFYEAAGGNLFDKNKLSVALAEVAVGHLKCLFQVSAGTNASLEEALELMEEVHGFLREGMKEVWRKGQQDGILR